MAHFAWLDANNIVYQVSAVDDWNLLDADGNESETVGIAYLHGVHGEEFTFVQCSWNTYRTNDGSSHHRNGGTPLRGQFAQIGDRYDAELDEFVSPAVEEQ